MAERGPARPGRPQSGDGEVGDERGDVAWVERAPRAEPLRRPVQRAEEGAGGDGRVAGAQCAVLDARGNQRADAAFIAIALGHNWRTQFRRQGIDLEVCRRALELIEQAEDVRRGQIAQSHRRRHRPTPRAGKCGEQAIEGPVLAEIEQLLFAAEVVIQIAGRKVGGDGDVAHAGGGEAAGAEHPRRRPHNLHPARLGSFRTAVR